MAILGFVSRGRPSFRDTALILFIITGAMCAAGLVLYIMFYPTALIDGATGSFERAMSATEWSSWRLVSTEELHRRLTTPLPVVGESCFVRFGKCVLPFHVFFPVQVRETMRGEPVYLRFATKAEVRRTRVITVLVFITLFVLVMTYLLVGPRMVFR